jgi:AcrR family transcriptional regulator
MPRARSPERLAAIVDAATEVFGRAGFVQAQMLDIAATAGVSVGTLYNYVEGKEALLLLCAENPFGGVSGSRPLPVPVLDRRALIEAVDATLAQRIRLPALERALGRSGLAPDTQAELAEIAGELYDLIAGTRHAADAMERCAADAPDLAELFYRGVRGRLLAQLGDYCTRLAGAGVIDMTIAPKLTARFVLETTTWWARHRHRDPEPMALDDHDARGIAVALIVRALCGGVGSAGADEQALQ